MALKRLRMVFSSVVAMLRSPGVLEQRDDELRKTRADLNTLRVALESARIDAAVYERILEAHEIADRHLREVATVEIANLVTHVESRVAKACRALLDAIPDIDERQIREAVWADEEPQ